MATVIEELQDQLEELDPMSDEFVETSQTLDVLRDMSYAIAEGFVTIEEGDDGEIRFFPVSMD